VSPTCVFLIGLLCFFALVAMGMPLAFAFALVGAAGIWVLKGLEPALSILGSAPWQWASPPSLIIIPLFVLMGEFAYQGGLIRDMYEAAYKWVSRLPGGLALATMIACTGFAACTGSSLASAAAMSTIGYPEMKQRGYDDRLAAGVVAAGGTLGILIPPSIPMMIYGFVTQKPIGTLFIAGILPGALIAGLYCTAIVALCVRNPGLGPIGPGFSTREKIRALPGVIPTLLLFMGVIGGLYLGVFSPSEAGTMGAFLALVIALVKRRLTRQGFISALGETVRLSCMILTLVIGAMIFMNFAIVSGAAAKLARCIVALPFPKVGILIVIAAMYLIVGMFLDVISATLIIVPIFAPVVASMGFDLIWFAVIVVILIQLGLITPPIGMNVFVVQGMTQVPMDEVFRGILPFVIATALGLIVLFLFPQIALVLPQMMS